MNRRRGKKGYLFTIGDELYPKTLRKSEIESVFDITVQGDYNAEDLYKEVSEKYNVFHIIVEQGNYCKRYKDKAISEWRGLIGRHAILLDDSKNISDVILSVIRVNEGENPESVVESSQTDSQKTSVRHALFD